LKNWRHVSASLETRCINGEGEGFPIAGASHLCKQAAATYNSLAFLKQTTTAMTITMDELEEHATKHSSHLSKTDADYRTNMMLALLEKDIPISLPDRYEIYRSINIPENVYQKHDTVAFYEALARRKAIILNW